ncbi:hypothetical protein Holit_03301 [Hollandina sp. SP2]
MIWSCYFSARPYDELMQITQTKTFMEWEEKLASENGIRVLAFNWYDGPRHFLTNIPVTTPADLKGQRIRTPGAPVWAKSVEAMGATPIAMGWNDSYNAIQSKSIDGAEAQHTATFGARLYEVGNRSRVSGLVYEIWVWSYTKIRRQTFLEIIHYRYFLYTAGCKYTPEPLMPLIPGCPATSLCYYSI